jgi:hypothetical protein
MRNLVLALILTFALVSASFAANNHPPKVKHSKVKAKKPKTVKSKNHAHPVSSH